jgi:hypothetical protein
MRKNPKTSCDFRIANSVLSLLLVVALLLPAAFGQANNSYPNKGGGYKRPVNVPLDRSEEDWSFLKDPELRIDPWDPLKYVALCRRGHRRASYSSLRRTLARHAGSTQVCEQFGAWDAIVSRSD